MMTKTKRLILATMLAVAPATANPAFAEPIVADVQVIDAGNGAWIVRVRSSEAQAFDVVEGEGAFTVRLHGARLSDSTSGAGATAFGAVAVAVGDGYVDLRVSFSSGLRATASQGKSADLVDVRITAEP